MCSAKVAITCRGLVQRSRPCVDEHAGELVADRAVQQRGDHRGIDAARQAEEHLVAPDLRADPRDRLLDDSCPCSSRRAAADVVHEAVQDRLALQRVRDLGMELHAVEAARLVGHAGDRRGRWMPSA
jgi:hypothetical protein